MTSKGRYPKSLEVPANLCLNAAVSLVPDDQASAGIVDFINTKDTFCGCAIVEWDDYDYYSFQFSHQTIGCVPGDAEGDVHLVCYAPPVHF